jgi:hypothetical protein
LTGSNEDLAASIEKILTKEKILLKQVEALLICSG